MIIKALSQRWPLFFGIFLVMIGSGLQGTLLGIRAEVEGFGTFVTGLLMSCYYFGFLGGYFFVPKFISEVGHIRVFAALASLASTTVLLHGVFPNEYVWGVARIITGFSYAGLLIVIESWLNNSATNNTRGSILALYLIISYGGMALGQFLLNLADPSEIELFIVISVAVSIALLPISLKKQNAPPLETPEFISLKRLFRLSPLGTVGMTFNGMASGTFFGIGSLYALSIGMSVAQIAYFIALFISGAIFFSIPLGWLSDTIGRRKVLIGACFAAAFFALVALVADGNNLKLLYTATFLFGGLSLSTYGLCVAYANDYLKPQQILSASSALVLVNGMGACIGPLVVSAMMSAFGGGSFFAALALIFIAVGSYGVYMSRIREAVPVDEQSDYVMMSAKGSLGAMHLAEEEYLDVDHQ